MKKAEIRLILASIEGHIGYQTIETILPALKSADPGSKIWQDITLKRDKTSYCVSDALGPFFLDKSMESARKSFGYSLSFDGATTKRLGLAKQLDIHITYWDLGKGQVRESLLSIIEITSETAEVLKNEVLAAIRKEGLKLENLRALGRDNPNVNKALVKLIIEEVKDSGGSMIDFGSCVLHTAHNGFEKGLGGLSVDISTLLKSLYAFFKKSTIRREDFTNELLDHNYEPSTFRRHLETRWLSMKPAAEKADKFWAPINTYFLTTLPEMASTGDNNTKKNAQDAMKTQAYDKVVTALKKPVCLTLLKAVIFLCDKFSGFLHALQSGSPMIHTLYDSCVKLLTAVLSCFVKKDKIPKDTRDLVTLDLSKNLRDMPELSPSAERCYRELSSSCRSSLKKELIAMYQTVAKYLQKNLHPLRSDLVRYLRALDPKARRSLSGQGNEHIVKAGNLLKCLSISETDSLKIQWDLLVQTSVVHDEKERIDTYYDKVLKDLDARHRGVDFTALKKFIHTALVLPSSNAFVERGFSQNKLILQSRESLSLQSLFGQRVTREAIKHYGGAEKVPISSALLAKHNAAHHAYRKRIEDEQKANRTREQDERDEREAARKRKIEEAERKDFDEKKKSLEAEEKELRDQLKFHNTMYDGMLQRAAATNDPVEMKASIAAQRKQREVIVDKEKKLKDVSTNLKQLLERRLNKKPKK